MKKIYLSGSIRNVGRPAALKLFQHAEDILSKDYTVYNPMKIHKPADATWADCMLVDIKYILKDIDSMYMLKNWKSSTGARIELAIAMEIGLDIIFEKDAKFDTDSQVKFSKSEINNFVHP